jgi:trans-2-enoyl-CoA reductase
MIDANAIAKEISAKKVAKKHIAANFDKETVDAKLKVNFNNGKTKQSLSVSMKMIKDEVIWLKGTKFITVFKAKITPTSVSYYSPFAKNYFEGDFSMIKKLLGVEINFEQLQNLFLGQSLLNVKEEKQDLEIVNNRYILSPEIQASMFDIFFTINPSHFKLDEQSIINVEKNLRLDVKYPAYNLVENVVFPSEINIKAKNSKSVTAIDFFYKSVVFNTTLNMSFSIPNGYKRLNF